MRIDDPARPKLANGRPAWKDAPQVVLPSITMTPLREAPFCLTVELRIIVNNVWKIIEVNSTEILSIVVEWYENPEETTRQRWGCEPPNWRQKQGPVDDKVGLGTSISIEDLGL